MIGLAQFTASMNVCNILTPVKINTSFIISQISINIGGKPYHEIKFNEVDAHKKTTSGRLTTVTARFEVYPEQRALPEIFLSKCQQRRPSHTFVIDLDHNRLRLNV